jgi:hypothetical protein
LTRSEEDAPFCSESASTNRRHAAATVMRPRNAAPPATGCLLLIAMMTNAYEIIAKRA